MVGSMQDPAERGALVAGPPDEEMYATALELGKGDDKASKYGETVGQPLRKQQLLPRRVVMVRAAFIAASICGVLFIHYSWRVAAPSQLARASPPPGSDDHEVKASIGELLRSCTSDPLSGTSRADSDVASVLTAAMYAMKQLAPAAYAQLLAPTAATLLARYEPPAANEPPEHIDECERDEAAAQHSTMTVLDLWIMTAHAGGLGPVERPGTRWIWCACASVIAAAATSTLDNLSLDDFIFADELVYTLRIEVEADTAAAAELAHSKVVLADVEAARDQLLRLGDEKYVADERGCVASLRMCALYLCHRLLLPTWLLARPLPLEVLHGVPAVGMRLRQTVVPALLQRLPWDGDMLDAAAETRLTLQQILDKAPAVHALPEMDRASVAALAAALDDSPARAEMSDGEESSAELCHTASLEALNALAARLT